MFNADGPPPSARALISRATVLRPRQRCCVLQLVDGGGDLDGEPSSGRILIVTVTPVAVSVSGGPAPRRSPAVADRVNGRLRL